MKSIAKLLKSSFGAINWQYDQLTAVEKSIIADQAELDAIKLWATAHATGLKPGDRVTALRQIDYPGAHADVGALGSVFQPCTDTHGPLIRWATGQICAVSEGDVEVTNL